MKDVPIKAAGVVRPGVGPLLIVFKVLGELLAAVEGTSNFGIKGRE